LQWNRRGLEGLGGIKSPTSQNPSQSLPIPLNPHVEGLTEQGLKKILIQFTITATDSLFLSIPNGRQLLGEQLDSLTIKELQQLEQQLDSSLKHIRSRKNQLMFYSISELQKKEKSLTDQNGVLQKLMEAEKEKNNALMNAHLREQQNRASTSLPSPPLSTVPDSLPTLNIGYHTSIVFSVSCICEPSLFLAKHCLCSFF